VQRDPETEGKTLVLLGQCIGPPADEGFRESTFERVGPWRCCSQIGLADKLGCRRRGSVVSCHPSQRGAVARIQDALSNSRRVSAFCNGACTNLHRRDG
jgi:hypothetical protein